MLCPNCVAVSAGYMIASSGCITAGYLAAKNAYQAMEKKTRMNKALQNCQPKKIVVLKPVSTVYDLKDDS